MPAPAHRAPHRVSWSTIAGLALVMLCARPAWSVIYVSGPATLDRSGETYVVSQNFSCSGTAFTITASNVVLDLGGHTVTYGTGGATSYGVNITGVNATVKNGTLTQAAPNTIQCHAIYSRHVSNTAGPIIHDLTINTHSAGSRGIYLNGAGQGLQIYSCVFNTSNTVVSLDDEGCPAIQLWLAPFGSATARALIHHNTINGAQRGIDLIGPEPVNLALAPSYIDIYSNEIHPLAPAVNAKISAGIHTFCANHCRIFNNVISTSQGRGIKLQYHSDYNEVYGNNIDVSDNQPDYYNNVFGIRLRHGGSYNKIHDNTIIARSANNNIIRAFQMGDEKSVAASGVPTYNEIYNNTFDLRWSGDIDAARACVVFGYTGAGNTFHDNTIISNSTAIEFFDPPISPVELRHNTILKGSSPNAGWKTVWTWGQSGVPGGPHTLLDTVRGTGVALDNVRWGTNGGSFYVDWYLTVTVKDAGGAAVSGATVTIEDKNGATVYTGTTASDGTVRAPIRQYKASSAGDTTYTPHTVTASKTGYDAVTKTVTVDASKSLTLALVGGSSVTLLKQASPASTTPSGVVTFTITYSNDTGSTIYNAVVTDAIPSAMTYVPGSAKLNGQTITPDPYQNGSLVVSLGNLAAKANGTITFRATVN